MVPGMTATAPGVALAETFKRCISMDASLAEQLATFAGAVKTLSPVFADAVSTLVARLEESDVGAKAPGPGEIMPPFHLPDETGRLVGLTELLEKGPTAVIFHRGHWCPYCRINSVALARAQAPVAALGGQMVAIMPDRQAYAQRLKAFAGSTFPFLSDIDNGYALSINLVFWVGAELERIIAGVGNDVPRYQGNDGWLLPVPATFVVGRDQVVRARFVDPDYRRRMAIEDLLAAVAAAD
jgi:peroxiredoxin